MANIIVGKNVETSDDVILKDGDEISSLIIGRSGAGKSRLIANMVMQNISVDETVIVIDPAGDLYDNLSDNIPKEKRDNIIFYSPEFGQSLDLQNINNVFEDSSKTSLIISLAKARLGEENCINLGKEIIDNIYFLSKDRHNLGLPLRKPVAVYIESVNNFFNNNLISALAEKRLSNMHFIASVMYLEQLDESSKLAVFGNLDNKFLYNMGQKDAELFAKSLNDVTSEDILNLPNGEAYFVSNNETYNKVIKIKI